MSFQTNSAGHAVCLMPQNALFGLDPEKAEGDNFKGTDSRPEK